MIALTWRQHRVQLLVGAVVLAAIAGYLIHGALQRDAYATSLGLFACLADHPTTCGTLGEAFFNHFGNVPNFFQLLLALPLLAGLFWGAPLIAREVETGTFRLVWTQSVSRGRWLAVKLATFLSATVIAAAIVSLSFDWWLGVADRMDEVGITNVNRLAPPSFDLTGVMPVGTTLFAFALGAAAGAVIRRVLPAMAVTVGVFFAVVSPLQSLRYKIFLPLSVSGPFGRVSPVQPGAYVLSHGYADAAGHPVTFDQILGACGGPSVSAGQGIPVSCLSSHGFRLTETYLPGNAYWPLQVIEAGSLTAAAVVLLATAVWWTTRRIS